MLLHKIKLGNNILSHKWHSEKDREERAHYDVLFKMTCEGLILTNKKKRGL